MAIFLMTGLVEGSAQVISVGDTVETKKLRFKKAGSILNKYTYDPSTNLYFITLKSEYYNGSDPVFLTPNEFEERLRKEERATYFKEKFNAVHSRYDKEESREGQRNLLPTFYTNSDFFKSIFDGDEIELIPQGYAEINLGVLFTTLNNPALSVRNRSNFTFDLDENINLSLRGHVGKRLQINANYDTESTFDFQNQIKLDYTPDEDDILQKLEVGNVNMPLSSSLIKGAQSLFGVKAQLQFGKTTITGVYSEQKSQYQDRQVRGGGAVENFEKYALDYDENRHYFLSHYFRDHYNEALKYYPHISSPIHITRVQVWITNRSNTTSDFRDTRNIVGIQDLGETKPENIGVFLNEQGRPINSPEFLGFIHAAPEAYPDNGNNDFNPLGIEGHDQTVLTPAIREISTVSQGFGVFSSVLNEGIDYAKLEVARQLKPSEYTLHPKLGYISLKIPMRSDETLAVAFQYTANGGVYQVGEFASDGINANQPVSPSSGPSPTDENYNQVTENKSLIVKLLKSPITKVKEPVWDLMMKNIYDLGATPVTQEDFAFRIFYTDPQPVNYLNPVEGNKLPDDLENSDLLQVFNLDNLNFNQDPVVGGDGFFDFVPGITIDSENGKLIFTTVEPFGKYLFDKLHSAQNETADYEAPETYNHNQTKYVFRSLYQTTKIEAEQEQSEKNKFQLTGSYKVADDQGIPIDAVNLSRGSVRVRADGRELKEGADYTVDYELGRVKIINEALKLSGTPIQISTENNNRSDQLSKRFAGLRVQHKFNRHLQIGGTFLNLTEKPQTHKSNYGDEAINNSMYGIDFNYSAEVPFLTRLVNKLPNLNTDVESRFSLRGEFAYLHPGSPKGDDFNGETTSYIDDFEAAHTTISVLSPHSWFLASAPVGSGGEKSNNDLASGYKRAKLNWYTIDPVFYSNERPKAISADRISRFDTRQIYKEEIFPNTDIREGDARHIFSLDLSYYPTERGMYNYNPASAANNVLSQPKGNFGGIMRGIENADFEQTNVQYIEFWMLDPYIYRDNAHLSKGTIVFNVGDISEDVLKDGKKQYENGLPEDGSVARTLETNFGRVPSSQSLTYTFDTGGSTRENQDLGLDGLNNAGEKSKFPAFSHLDDPSNDDYQYYLSREGGIVQRYRRYNGLEGNSPAASKGNNRGNTTLPSVEDVNQDNTMNTVNSYFEYKIPIFSGMSVDKNTSYQAGIDQDYISDVRDIEVTLKNGQQERARWIKFRIPLRTEAKYAVGGIRDLRSVRFMRLYLTGFDRHVVLRFGTLDLVRGDYTKYDKVIGPKGTDPENTPEMSFSSASVSQENSSNYMSPPGVYREEIINRNQTLREDEQALSLKVKQLTPGDARAVYKNFKVDMRQFKNLRMFMHAESLPSPSPQLCDNEMTAVIRMGTDIKHNFYQIEIPLKVTRNQIMDRDLIWPEKNNLELPLTILEKVKSKVIGNDTYDLTVLNLFDEEGNPLTEKPKKNELRIGIKGNPSFGDVRVLMLGLKNTGSTDISGEVWFNELRLSEMKNSGGWAARLNMDTNLADFISISAIGYKSTHGFGSIEQGSFQRSRDDVESYGFVTNLNAGHLFPKRWGMTVPISYNRAEEFITPQYSPKYKDIHLKSLLSNTDDPDRRHAVKIRARDYTKRQSINLIGLSKQRMTDKRPLPVDLENFMFSGSYNQVDHRDYRIESSKSQNVNLGVTYDYNFHPFNITPFKKLSGLDSSEYFRPLRDFNFDLLPNSVSATGNFLRQFNIQKFRQSETTAGDIGTPTLYQRDYRFNWGFTVNDKLTESLNFVYTTTNNRVIQHYIKDDNTQDNYGGIWDRLFDIGLPNQHHQSLQVNYDLPFDKFPSLRFINVQYSYTSNFQWQRGSEINRSIPTVPDLGNTIQNSQTHQLNGTFNMQRFYDYIGLTKKKRKRRSGNERQNRLGFKRTNDYEDRRGVSELSFGDKMANTGINILTAFRRVSINYEETGGTYLPGYLPSVGFIGSLKPTTGFVFGSQSDVREIAARKGWLTLYQGFNESYMTHETKAMDIHANLDLLPDLTIDLHAERNYSENYSERFRVEKNKRQYESLTPRYYGNFNISTIMIGTAFQNSKKDQSAGFKKFRENRLVIANRLAGRAGIDLSDPDNIDQKTGYPKGFGKRSQQVLLPAFLAAYTAGNVSDVSLISFRDIPLPNWDLKYTGLMRLDFFRSRFRRFSLQHGYRAGYTVNQFQSNLNYDRDAPFESKNRNGDFRSKILIANINLAEQFSPLLKVDMEMRNAISITTEIDKDRVLAFSFDNDMLTEIQGAEYRLGLGCRIKDLKMITHFDGVRRVLSGDLNLKADFSYRRNKTIVRYLDTNNDQITSGQERWEVHFIADYTLSSHLSASFYYDHDFSKFFVSSTFPQTTIRSGIRLRYRFGG